MEMRVIDCKNCGERDLLERSDPLRITFNTGTPCIVYGLAFFKCDVCEELYTVKQQEISELFSKIYEKATEGMNTLIM